MSKERKTRKPMPFLVFVALALAFIVAVLLLLMPRSFVYLFTHLDRFSIVFGFSLPVVACLFFWQLGVLVVGLLCGCRLLSLQLLGLVIENHHGRPAFKLADQIALFSYAIVPVENRLTLWRRRIVMLSGAFSCLALCALAFALFLRFPREGGISLCLLLLWPMALFFALWDGIPHSLGGEPNSMLTAMRIRAELTDQERFELQAATVATRVSMGDSLADLPAECFEIPEGIEASDPIASWMAYAKRTWLLDRGEDLEAHEWLLRLCDGEYRFLHMVRLRLRSALMTDALMGMPMPEVAEPVDAEAIAECVEALGNSADALMLRYAQALLIQRDENKATRLRNRYIRLLRIIANVGDPARCYRRLDAIKRCYEETNAHEFSSSAGVAE